MSTVTIDNVTYTLNSGDYTASVTSNTLSTLSSTTSVTIPATISDGTNTYSVTLFYSNAFENSSMLTSVTIGSNVTSTGHNTFLNCSQLTSVTIGSGVISIGSNLFKNCYELTSVTIPNSVTYIDRNAFENCSKLTYVNIGNAVTSIGDYVFNGCSLLSSVTIGDSFSISGILKLATFVPSITTMTISPGNSSFFNGSSGEVYNISGSTASIVWCPRNATDFEIPESVTNGSTPYNVISIGADAFDTCSLMTSITIPNSVLSIAKYAFYATSMSLLTIPNSVTSIGEGAFESCTTLASVYFLGAKPTIGTDAFNGINGSSTAYYLSSYSSWGSKPTGFATLTTFTFSDLRLLGYSVSDLQNLGVADSDILGAGYSASELQAAGYTNAELVAAGYTVTVTIDNVTYTLNTGNTASVTGNTLSTLTNVIIPSSITDTDATSYSVTSIGMTAFQYSSNLASIVIPDSVTIINNGSLIEAAFYSCSELTSVTIGNAVTSIGNLAFYNCSKLTSVTIPDAVTLIGNSAFNGCSNLTSVTIGSSVTSIGGSAFQSCSELTAVTIPDAVTLIGNSAFLYCSNMTSVTIGTGLTTMEIGVFYNCGTTLTSMYFLGDYPSGIDSNTFYGDSNLTVYYVDGASGWSTYDSATIGRPAYLIPTITSTTSASVSISADSALSTVYVYTSADSGTTWTTNSVTMTSGSGTLSNLSSGTWVSTIANVYDDTTYLDYCQTVTNSTPTPSSNVCFPAKTPVLTNQGPVNIEDIDPAVHTIRNKKIVAITKTVAHDKNLVRIAKHALGHLYPEKTTFISQNHKVFFQGQMVKAKHLVNEANGVTLVPYNGQVLYNVLLAEHEKMQVNNLIVETLHPEHKVSKLYRILKNVDASHHGKLIALFNKCDHEQRLRR